MPLRNDCKVHLWVQRCVPSLSFLSTFFVSCFSSENEYAPASHFVTFEHGDKPVDIIRGWVHSARPWWAAINRSLGRGFEAPVLDNNVALGWCALISCICKKAFCYTKFPVAGKHLMLCLCSCQHHSTLCVGNQGSASAIKGLSWACIALGIFASWGTCAEV